MDKPYVVFVFPHLGKGFCLDRDYEYHGDNESWKEVTVGDIVQTDTDVFYPQCPDWAHELKDQGHPWCVFWTNYYE